MPISKPTVGATGWNTAVDLVIDAVNGTSDDVKELARDTVGTALVAGANVTVTVNDGSNTITISTDGPSGFVPADHGYLGWSVDPANCASSNTVTAGVLYLQKVKVLTPGTSSIGALQVATAGTSLTNCFLGLFDSTGARIALSANQATAWQSGGYKATSWASPVVVTPGTYYTGILVGGGTPPLFSRVGNSNAVNAGLSAPGLRFGTSGTGQTAIPSSVTLSSVATDSVSYFTAVKV